MSRDPRDWQIDNDKLAEIKAIFEAPGEIFYGSISEHDGEVSQSVEDASGEFKWLIDQVDKLKEDNARWLCKHTTAEQKYLTQSNVIAELKGREKKLREAYERTYKSFYANHATMNHMENTDYEKGQISGLIQASNILVNAFSTLYPLDREESGNV
ncbi:hypothetical protein PMSD_25940 [Paenibacillus macquariensis subsp. defensor]|nr:hypothetical protein PMSD_25940 [Paenibacillus macquariensis subsp. defensor]